MKTTTKSKTTTHTRPNGAASKAKKAPNKPVSETMETMDTSETENASYLDSLFMTMLKEAYWSEKQQVAALAEMQQQCTTRELHDAFEDHLYVTKKHIARLERVFSTLGSEPAEKNCLAIAALIEEARQMISDTKSNTMTRDAALIIAAQRLEHYEIATYG